MLKVITLLFLVVAAQTFIRNVRAEEDELEPTTPRPTPACGPNELYNECGTQCPLTCQHPEQRICVRICTPGCFCEEGFIRDEETNACIPLEECPLYKHFRANDL